jgi:hypothetical protein
MNGSKYGVGYIDGTEKIIQLNRAVENNLMAQVEYLTNMLMGQLGISPAVLSGTATPEELAQYQARVVGPLCKVITSEMTRKFLSRTAITQGQAVVSLVDPFLGATVMQIAQMADPLKRNTIMSSNELRSAFGLEPDDDPASSKLVNNNMPISDQLSPDGGVVPEEEPVE